MRFICAGNGEISFFEATYLFCKVTNKMAIIRKMSNSAQTPNLLKSGFMLAIIHLDFKLFLWYNRHIKFPCLYLNTF